MEPNNSITVICSIEHIPTLNPAGDTLETFGMNLSAVWTGDNTTFDIYKAILTPWKLKPIVNFAVAVVPRGTAPSALIPIRVKPQFFRGLNLSSDSTANEFDKFRTEFRDKTLEDRWTQHSGQQAGPFNPRSGPIDVTEKSGRKWQTLLTQVAVLPVPMPQLLNLSFIFQVPKSEFEGKQDPVLYAVPFLPIDAVTTLNPEIVQLDSSSNPVYLKLRYPVAVNAAPTPSPSPSPATPSSSPDPNPSPAVSGPDILAVCGACDLRQPVAANTPVPYLDLSTLWVNAELNENDWRSELENDMAGAFDLSHRIIELLQGNLESAGSDDVKLKGLQNNLAKYIDMFVASLRDIAGVGYDLAPYGKSLLVYLMNLSGAQPSTPPISFTIAEWKDFLRINLSQFDRLGILSNDATMPTRISISQAISEMETLHDGVLEPENLLKLTMKQWDSSNPSYLSRIDRERLKKINLRNELAFENLGRFWNQFIASGIDDFTKTKEKFKCYFQAYCYLRFTDQLPAIDGCVFGTNPGELPKPDLTHVNPRPLAADLTILGELKNYVARWSDEFWQDKAAVETAKAPPPKGKKLVDLVPQTPSARNVTFQVDKVAASPTERDFLEAINGVAVLIRKYGDNSRVTCLNMAKVKLGDKDTDPSLFEFPVLVPYPITYVNKLRSPNITYSNNPLTAKSPVAHMTEKANELSGTTDKEFDRLVFFDYAANFSPGGVLDPNRNADIQALINGEDYHIKAFCVNAQGAIPKPLCPTANFSPGEIDYKRLPITLLPQPAAGSPVSLQNFPCRRRAKVGQVRILGKDGKSCVEEMIIPDKVYPLFRELEKEIDRTAEPNGPSPKKSLLLLTPEDDKKFIDGFKEFGFRVRLPAVDIHAWDQWVLKGNIHDQSYVPGYINALRGNTWAGYKTRTNDGKEVTDECAIVLPANDATMDDPAVLNMLYVERVKLNDLTGAPMGTPTVTQIPIKVNLPPAANAPAGGDSLSYVQSDDANIKIYARASHPSDPTANVSNIYVENSGVYNLKISALVNTKHFDASPQLFDQIYDPVKTEKVRLTPGATDEYFKVGTYDLYVEVANSRMPDQTVVDGYVTQDFLASKDNEGKGDAVRVRLINSGTPDPLLHRGEVHRQMWRWQGRNTLEHPILQNDNPGTDQVKDWEIAEFANRLDGDFTIGNMTSGRRSTAGGPVPPLPVTVHTFEYLEYLTGDQAGNQDLRAHHYRFKVNVYSRYEGLFKEPSKASVLSPTWKPCIVPCRLSRDIPVPKVKFIFPLTQSFDLTNTSGTAGLLVVLDEPWHEVAGLAEQFRAEVEFTEAYKWQHRSDENGNVNLNSNTDQNSNHASEDANYAKEAGKDPVFSSQSIIAKTAVFVPDKIIGPIGHSFDTNTDAPYIGATSFIIPAPEIRERDGDPPKKFDWGMCQVRFQRRIVLSKIKELKSNLTDPIWVEYLPEFTKYSTDQVDTLSHQIINSDKLLQIRKREDKTAKDAIRLQITDEKDSFQFSYFMVLTKEVFDIAGRKGQEAFVGVLKLQDSRIDWAPLKQSTSKNIEFPLPDLGNNTFLARILKIQRNEKSAVKIESAADLWDSLFNLIWSDKMGSPIKDIDRTRIVSISDPISSDNEARC